MTVFRDLRNQLWKCWEEGCLILTVWYLLSLMAMNQKECSPSGRKEGTFYFYFFIFYFFTPSCQPWRWYPGECSSKRNRLWVSRYGLAVRRKAGKQKEKGLGSTPVRLSLLFKEVVCRHCLLLLPLMTIGHKAGHYCHFRVTLLPSSSSPPKKFFRVVLWLCPSAQLMKH